MGPHKDQPQRDPAAPTDPTGTGKKETVTWGVPRVQASSSQSLADPQAQPCLWWWFSTAVLGSYTELCIALYHLSLCRWYKWRVKYFYFSSHDNLDNTTLLSSWTPFSVLPTSIPGYSVWQMKSAAADRTRWFLDEALKNKKKLWTSQVSKNLFGLFWRNTGDF